MIPGLKLKNSQRWWIIAVWLLAVSGGLVMPLTSTEALATTMYSYIDEQGTPVITDNLNTIPERYRARVKTTEQISTAPQGTSTAGTIHARVTNWGRQLTDMASGAVRRAQTAGTQTARWQQHCRSKSHSSRPTRRNRD